MTGCGSIACPELAAVFSCDVLLHGKQVGRFAEGQCVTFAATLNEENRPQAFDLLEVSAVDAACVGAAYPDSAMGAAAGLAAAASAARHLGGGACTGTEELQATRNTVMRGGKKGDAKGNQVVLGEFLGVVKNYNTEKGFGFIACDALSGQVEGDVYLHQKQVGVFQVGDEVRFQAYLHNGRLQGRDLKVATGLVGPQAGAGGGGGLRVELGTYTGSIKSVSVEKGYGFITCSDLTAQGFTGDVFLHQKNFGQFHVGEQVLFSAHLLNGKLQGRELQALPGALPAQKRPRAA